MTNTFAGLGASISDTRAFVMLHELVHVYLGAVTNQRIIKMEAFAIQDCFEIKAHNSRFNSANYVFYSTSAKKVGRCQFQLRLFVILLPL